MKDNKEFIKGIYDKYEEQLKDNTIEFPNKKKKVIKRTMKIISSVAVLLIISTLIINKDKNKIHTNSLEEESKTLATVGTFDNFYKIINDYSSKNDSYRGSLILEDTISQVESTNKEMTSDSVSEGTIKSDSYSKTNNQVNNVEESDIVKTDGKNIYYATYEKLVIVNAENPNDLKEIYKENFTNTDFRPQELYIYEDKLILLGNTYVSSRNGLKTYTETISSVDCVSYNNKTKAIIYELNGKIEKVREIELTGNLLSSRMIGESLYVVSNQYINTYRIKENQISDLSEDSYKPVYKDTAISEKEKKIDFSQIECFENMESANLLTIAGLNINENEEVNIKTFLGSGEEIYVSENNMYIAKTNSNYNIITREYVETTTTILKLALDKSNIKYMSEVEVPGFINNQFSMDESNGTFKIATTIGSIWNSSDNRSNSLYILDENLNELGRIEGLAKGEKIYSVRYTEDRAYIVTFEQVDPLFVIDISDSKKPKLLGELKIEGYSTYLHPYDENHLIGFGYDTTYNGKVIKTNGLKMVMFDITDLSNPRELFKVEIGNRYTSSILLNNHKALLFSKEKNIIGFPINIYGGKNTSYKAQIYKIDLEKGFKLQGEIVQNGSNYKNQIERIIYIGNTYYVLSAKEIKSIDMDTLEKIDSIEI